MRLLGLRAGFLALIAGSADVAGWLGSGIFAAHMTGNTALLGIALAQRHFDKAEFRALTIASAFAGFVSANLLLRVLPKRQRLVGAIACALALVAAFLGHAPWDVVVLAAALAFQNAAFHKFGGQAINITFLTGDLQTLATALVSGRRDEPTRVKLGIVPAIWVAYVAGAAATALLFHHLAHPILPAAICLGLLVLLPRTAEDATSGASSPAR